MTLEPLSDAQFAAIHAAAAELFAKAVSQGMHAPFALDCDYWGREYAERLLDTLTAAERTNRAPEGKA
jgi:hypothetical protein